MEPTNQVDNPLEDPRHFPGVALWLGAGLMLLILALGFYFREAKTPGATGVQVADVTANPNEFVGKTVTVEGAVDDVLGPRAFILEDEGPGGEMLVIASAADVMPRTALDDEGEVQVVGEVRPYDAAKTPEVAGIAPTDERLSEVRGKPVLYASQVNLPPQGGEKRGQL